MTLTFMLFWAAEGDASIASGLMSLRVVSVFIEFSKISGEIINCYIEGDLRPFRYE